jgi:hypothetical protein
VLQETLLEETMEEGWVEEVEVVQKLLQTGRREISIHLLEITINLSSKQMGVNSHKTAHLLQIALQEPLRE